MGKQKSGQPGHDPDGGEAGDTLDVDDLRLVAAVKDRAHFLIDVAEGTTDHRMQARLLWWIAFNLPEKALPGRLRDSPVC